jgi:hypothetical protein
MNKRKLRSTYRKYVFGYHFEVVEPRPVSAPVQQVELIAADAPASLAGPRLRGVQLVSASVEARRELDGFISLAQSAADTEILAF